MADQDQVVDTDYSGRPYRRPTVEEILHSPLGEYSPYDLGVDLPDGRRAVCGGRGKYYLEGEGGLPDRDHPVHLPGLSLGSPDPGALIVQFE